MSMSFAEWLPRSGVDKDDLPVRPVPHCRRCTHYIPRDVSAASGWVMSRAANVSRRSEGQLKANLRGERAESEYWLVAEAPRPRSWPRMTLLGRARCRPLGQQPTPGCSTPASAERCGEAWYAITAPKFRSRGPRFQQKLLSVSRDISSSNKANLGMTALPKASNYVTSFPALRAALYPGLAYLPEPPSMAGGPNP
jgi:hypothetical protein